MRLGAVVGGDLTDTRLASVGQHTAPGSPGRRDSAAAASVAAGGVATCRPAGMSQGGAAVASFASARPPLRSPSPEARPPPPLAAGGTDSGVADGGVAPSPAHMAFLPVTPSGPTVPALPAGVPATPAPLLPAPSPGPALPPAAAAAHPLPSPAPSLGSLAPALGALRITESPQAPLPRISGTPRPGAGPVPMPRRPRPSPTALPAASGPSPARHRDAAALHPAVLARPTAPQGGDATSRPGGRSRPRSAPPARRALTAPTSWLALGQRVIVSGLGPGLVTVVPAPADPRVFCVRLLGGGDVSVAAENVSLPPASRTWCPVPECLCADARRHRGWASLDAMRPHLNAHCAGLHDGRIPDGWLRDFGKILCPQCGMVCAARNQCCTRCWPARRAALPAAQAATATMAANLPSLADVQSTDIPTLKHVPLRARPQWARAVRLALGDVEAQRSHDSLVQLLMLPKCCLCLPASGRGGRKHRKQSERYTLSRLARWADGERATLFRDAPRAKRRTRPAREDEAAARARADRAEGLAREGLWSKAAAALLDVGVADISEDTRTALEALHPPPTVALEGFSCAGMPPPRHFLVMMCSVICVPFRVAPPLGLPAFECSTCLMRSCQEKKRHWGVGLRPL